MGRLRQTVCAVLIIVALLLAGPACAQSTPVTPAHPVTTEQVKQLMAVTHATERMRDGMHKMIAQQQASMPMLPAGFWTDFEAEISKIDWVEVATPVYQKYMSEEDAAKAIAFYSTEAGQRTLDSSMAVILEMNAKGFDIGKEVGTRLGQKYAAQIQENMKNAQPANAASPK